MLGNLARLILPYAGVRDELRAARNAARRGFYSLRMEWLSGGLKSERHGDIKPGIKINVGCGPLIREDWVNVDLFPRKGAAYVDVRNGLPFTAAQAVHIHCEHFMEHLSFEEAVLFLRESYRVLMPGGTLRIIVPDAAKYMAAYCRGDTGFFAEFARLGNAQTDLDTPVKVINQMFRMGGDHKFAWDFHTLAKEAKQIGFSEAIASSYNDQPAEFAIDGTDDWRKAESLYATLRK